MSQKSSIWSFFQSCRLVSTRCERVSSKFNISFKSYWSRQYVPRFYITLSQSDSQKTSPKDRHFCYSSRDISVVTVSHRLTLAAKISCPAMLKQTACVASSHGFLSREDTGKHYWFNIQRRWSNHPVRTINNRI